MERLKNSLSQIDVQVHRCKRTTQNLLRFARRTKSVLETLDLNGFLKEMIELMERDGVVSKPDGSKPREVLVRREHEAI